MILRRPLSVLYLGAGCAVLLAYFVLPLTDWRPKFALYALVSFSAVAALAYGIRRYRPAHRLVWILFAASQVVYFAADITFYTYHYARHDSSYPAPADALYLAHYPFLVAGLVLLGRRRQLRLGDLLDTLIVGTAFALVAWIVLMDPYTHGSSGSHLLRLTSLAYPVMDLMVLFAALRLIGPGLRLPAMSFLAAGLVFLLFSDFVYGWLQAKGRYGGPGDLLDGTWMAFYLCLGAAALSPSMRVLGEKREPTPVTLAPARIAALTAAALVAPVTAIVERASDKPVHVLAGATASIVLFALVVARLADVARAQQRAQAERERLIGRVVEVAEHERSRVAAELHDGPIQRLTALAMRLELLANQVTRGEVEEAFASMHRVRDELSAEMHSLRSLMSSLRPTVVDERGLPFALEECAREVLDRTVTVNVECTADTPLPSRIETVLYRIAREALLNAHQHAGARRVDIRLWQIGDELLLSVRDDGHGFDASGFARGAAGLPGLTSMLELAQSLGGDVRVTSGRGAGTEVRAAVPLVRVPGYGSELSQVTSAG